VEQLRRERQAIADLEERVIAIRAAIANSNANTHITVGGTTRSVTEWLAWRKEVAPGAGSFLAQLRNRIDQVRQAQARGQVPRTVGPELAALSVRATATSSANREKAPEIIINLDERQLAQESENHEQILGQLDGQLSLKNATTEIRI
jgi:hypothetical protein